MNHFHLAIALVGIASSTAAPPQPKKAFAPIQSPSEETEMRMDEAIREAKSKLSINKRKRDAFGRYQKPEFIPTKPVTPLPRLANKQDPGEETPELSPPTAREGLRDKLRINGVDNKRNTAFLSVNGKWIDVSPGESFTLHYDKTDPATGEDKRFFFQFRLKAINPETLDFEELGKKEVFKFKRPR